MGALGYVIKGWGYLFGFLSKGYFERLLQGFCKGLSAGTKVILFPVMKALVRKPFLNFYWVLFLADGVSCSRSGAAVERERA